MKRILLVCTLMCTMVCPSCKKDDSPVSGSATGRISIAGYGASIESSFYKLWSDSSWEKFGRMVTLNGTAFVTVVTSDGSEYFYSVLGYAGFSPQGQSMILFDTPLPSLPDTMVFNQSYMRQTTFSHQGVSYTLKVEESVLDTASVSVPFGTFSPCLWFRLKSTLSAGGQSETQTAEVWLAKGPSDIQQTLNSGALVTMIKGRVNGQGWGMPYPKPSPATAEKTPFTFGREIARHVFRR